LLFIGTVGKSAQWPLHVWLPDAMEGPTPVSAMIHAATMVSAGVYMAIRIFPLLSLDAHTMTVVAFIGSFTALFAATIAVAQNDIKKVLAYSTISQLGFMIAALGVHAYVAAAFHLVTHAFFKALLFLGSGSVIHGMEHGVLHTGEHVDAQDMFNMGGLRKKMPITFWTFLIGGLALSGFPVLTAGFWSKDAIFAEAFGNGHLLVFIVLALAAFLTAFYTMRQITLTFFGEARSQAAEHASETTWTMTMPLVVLAVFAVAIGWVGMPAWFTGGMVPDWFHEFVGGTLAQAPAAVAFNWIPVATSLVVALGGLFCGWLAYRKVSVPSEDRLQIPLLKNKYYFDEIYAFLFVRPAKWIAEKFTSEYMDQVVIDGVLHNLARFSLFLGHVFRNYFDKPVINEFLGDGAGKTVRASGFGLRKIQAGRVQYYMIVAIVILVIFAFLFYLLRLGM
jgi:NADH-quinone oxidoreductase subunit L